MLSVRNFEPVHAQATGAGPGIPIWAFRALLGAYVILGSKYFDPSSDVAGHLLAWECVPGPRWQSGCRTVLVPGSIGDCLDCWFSVGSKGIYHVGIFRDCNPFLVLTKKQ